MSNFPPMVIASEKNNKNEMYGQCCAVMALRAFPLVMLSKLCLERGGFSLCFPNWMKTKSLSAFVFVTLFSTPDGLTVLPGAVIAFIDMLLLTARK